MIMKKNILRHKFQDSLTSYGYSACMELYVAYQPDKAITKDREESPLPPLHTNVQLSYLQKYAWFNNSSTDLIVEETGIYSLQLFWHHHQTFDGLLYVSQWVLQYSIAQVHTSRCAQLTASMLL